MRAKILIVDNSNGYTGAFKSIWNYSQLLSHRYEFHYCIPEKSTISKFLENNKMPFQRLNFIEITRQWTVLLYFPQLLINSIKIKRYCEKNKIDIVHINDLYNMTGVILKIFFDVKLVYHVRLLPSSYVNRLYKIWIKIISIYADELISVSQIAVGGIKKYSTRQINLLYDTLGHSGRRNETVNKSEVIQLLYPANYTFGKGQQYAIQALAIVAKKNPHIHLTFVGDDFSRKANIEFKNLLQAQTEKLELTDFITLRGFERNLLNLISASDIVLNFSESESFSMVCLEALSYGAALIATDCGGPAELFEDGISGILVPNRDVEKMAEAMLLLINDYKLRIRLTEQGLRYVRKKFDGNSLATQLDQLYKRLL